MEQLLVRDLPLAPAAITRDFTRADLVFYGVEHKGPSYEALVFLNAPDANLATALDVETGFAGSFVIFGHGGCYGDTGHCPVPVGAPDPFDSRPQHGLAPQTKMVDVTEAIRHPRCAGEVITITVLPILPGAERARQGNVLFFSDLRLLFYR
jgi:hypothetical protein